MNFTVLKKNTVIKTLLLVISLLILFPLLSISSAHTVFNGNSSRLLPIYSVKTEEKKVAISFDCAWGVDYTDELLSIMKEENIKCTFFCVEFWSTKHIDYLKKISEMGHEIGTHSATHPYMSKLSSEQIKRELETSMGVIERATGKKVQLFRPPYGDYSNTLIETAKSLGLYTIQWSVDSLDWKDLSASEITKRVVSRVENGSIVLFHNQGLNTAKALRGIIKELKEKGYEFVKIGELIYRENFKIEPDGSQVKINN